MCPSFYSFFSSFVVSGLLVCTCKPLKLFLVNKYANDAIYDDVACCSGLCG